jgi:hypothetical protein
MKQDDMDGTHSTHQAKEECIQNFSWNLKGTDHLKDKGKR